MTQLTQGTRAESRAAVVDFEMPSGAVLAHWRRSDHCPAIPAAALVISGTLAVRMPGCPDEHCAAGDVVRLDLAVDAWTIGQQPCLLAALGTGGK
ncbi:cupin domain-containing protein [Spelaeicoccus albus]|uniref:Uncharacterized protein n=1 Tax=Spelaeicoccus albus TaxID=1280376 RepID=A0A7Z0ABJ5_9MICO|nr:hypothetical protein [Spelaeicoccus albus]NYI66628.1 hypothetical protein [Spelaeicoccus albus]